MGNVIGTSTTQRDIADPTEEWLHDLITNKSLDFSRKVSHNQFLKVTYYSILNFKCITLK